MSVRLYSQNNFPNQNLDNSICCICHDVIFNAKGNDACCHIYCETCINQWVLTSNKCPICVRFLKLVNNKYFETQNIYNLKYHCLNHGCTDSFEVGSNSRNIIQHQLDCPYQKVTCDVCGIYTEIRQEMINHKQSVICKDVLINKYKDELIQYKKLCSDQNQIITQQKDQIEALKLNNHALIEDLHCYQTENKSLLRKIESQFISDGEISDLDFSDNEISKSDLEMPSDEDYSPRVPRRPVSRTKKY